MMSLDVMPNLVDVVVRAEIPRGNTYVSSYTLKLVEALEYEDKAKLTVTIKRVSYLNDVPNS